MNELELLKEKTKTLILRYNPNHDSKGRFSSNGGGGGSSGGSDSSNGSGSGSGSSNGKAKSQVDEKTNLVKSRLSNEVKPFKKESSVDMKKVEERAGVGEADAKKCVDVAERVYSTAAAKEPAITKDVVSAVDGVDGKMYGLDFRLKQPTSMAGKIGADARSDKSSFDQAGNKIKDAVRYTAVVDESNFTNGYNSIKSNLESKGYKEVRCKNFYQTYADGESSQKAVQCIYEDPSGYKFELQFHTPKSQGAKELNHPLYEEQRNVTTSEKRKTQLSAQMRSYGEQVPNPKGVLTIKSHG